MSLLSPHPILWQNGAFVLYTHGFFFALGALAAVLCMLPKAAENKLSPSGLVSRLLVIVVAGLFAARIGYLISYPQQWPSLSQVWSIWDGGLVSYFGMAGGLAIAWLYVRRLSKEQRAAWADSFIIAALLGWAIGRWGNYYAVESYGVTSTSWSAFYGRVPVQLFESFWCLGVAVFLAPRRWSTGRVAVSGLLLYLAGRFCI